MHLLSGQKCNVKKKKHLHLIKTGWNIHNHCLSCMQLMCKPERQLHFCSLLNLKEHPQKSVREDVKSSVEISFLDKAYIVSFRTGVKKSYSSCCLLKHHRNELQEIKRKEN